MISQQLFEFIKDKQIEYVVAVPCQEFLELIELIRHDSDITLLSPAREDDGLGILIGLTLSDKKCLGIFQDTLLGNSQNVFALITRCTKIGLNLWLGSRSGEFLQRNLVHEFITAHFGDLTSDNQIKTAQLVLPDINQLKPQQLQKIAQSYIDSDNSLSILQVVSS